MFCNVWQTLMEKAFPGDLLGVKDDGTVSAACAEMMVIKMIQLAPTYEVPTLSHKIASDDGHQNRTTYTCMYSIQLLYT